MNYDIHFMIAWLVILCSGGVLEGVALWKRGKPDTLSELVWFVLRKHRAIWLVGFVFMAWLNLHFLTFGMFP